VVFDFKNYDDKLKEGFPDGLALDLNGDLWVACWKGWCVIKIDAQTGKLYLEQLKLKYNLNVIFRKTSRKDRSSCEERDLSGLRRQKLQLPIRHHHFRRIGSNWSRRGWGRCRKNI
jgi:hypothetical protein